MITKTVMVGEKEVQYPSDVIALYNGWDHRYNGWEINGTMIGKCVGEQDVQ